MSGRNGTMRDRPDVTMADRFSELRSDYAAAKDTRFRRKRTGLAPMGAGADWHTRSETAYLRIIEQARDMDRNDAVVGTTIDRAVTNTVQDGIVVSPQTGDDALDADLAARWGGWAEDPDQCDVAGELCFTDMEYMALRTMLVDGDIIALPTDGGALQLIEGHRLRTPTNTRRNVVLGVLLDEQRRRLEYWFTKDDVDPTRTVGRVSEMQRVSARDSEGHRSVFHIYAPKRVTQTRGVTALAPIFDILGMFEDLNFAHLVQAQVVACFAVFRQREADWQPGGVEQQGERTSETLADGSTRTLEGIGPGMQIEGAPGETLQGFAPNIPNPEFFPHVKLVLTLVGINLGVPLVMMLLDAKETNFSGWRGAVDQARLGFRRNQRNLINRFHKPVWRWKVRDWMTQDGALRRAAERDGIDILGHTITPPRWPYIDPSKDVKSDADALKNWLVAPDDLHRQRGRDPDAIIEKTVAYNVHRMTRGMEEAEKLNKQFPDAAVDWREIAGFDLKGRRPSPSPRTGAPVTPATDTSSTRDDPPPPDPRITGGDLNAV